MTAHVDYVAPLNQLCIFEQFSWYLIGNDVKFLYLTIKIFITVDEKIVNFSVLHSIYFPVFFHVKLSFVAKISIPHGNYWFDN